MDEVAHGALVGQWTHSHEDDTADTRVYRPSSFPFPPARGRDSFELAADGTLIEQGIGPADRPAASRGSWEVDAGDRLVLRSGARAGARVLRIVAASPDRLVFQR